MHFNEKFHPDFLSDYLSYMLYQQQSFIVPLGYTETTKTSSDIEIYQSFFVSKENNPMVLYKMLSGPEHLIFIGIGYETDYDKIKNEILTQSENKISFQEYFQDKSFIIRLNRDSISEVTHFLQVLKSGNKYLFSVLNNKNVQDSAFIEKFIHSNIKTK